MKSWIVLFVIFLCPVYILAGKGTPEIKGQRQLTTQQGQSITIQLSDLIVDAKDSKYPSGFFIEIFDGKHYQFSGNTVTPNSNFSGTLEVELRVSDGHNASKKFKLRITVQAVQQTNVAPIIIGNLPISIEGTKPFTISLSQLIVTDPDNNYPKDFTLKVISGNNYVVAGNSIIPSANLVGLLIVNVVVNDGKNDSPVFGVTIQIDDKKNTKPIITGQAALTTTKNKPISIQLTHLTVVDPDNIFPTDFQLTIHPGQNYTNNANAVIPSTDFVGTLSVGISVSDGKTESDIYFLKISVTEENALRIIGQKSLTMLEDSIMTLAVTDLVVNDPNDRFPTGFSMTILPEQNYTVSQQMIRPTKNFFGNLSVQVQLNEGTENRGRYTLLVVVSPVNDPPMLTWDNRTVEYNKEKSPLSLASDAVISDPDDTNLQSAEIAFSFDNYQKGNDIFRFQNNSTIKSVFDSNAGIMYLIGNAPIEVYQQTIRTLQYDFKTLGDTVPLSDSKMFYIKLYDGKLYSEAYEKEIAMMEDIPLEIPTGFTPNNDNANDTWYIKPQGNSSALSDAVVRVFTRRGVKVFETIGFAKAWDGKMNGDLLPADSYFYTIEINATFRKISKSGVVTLLR